MIIKKLKQSYPSRYGEVKASFVDLDIFIKLYMDNCMGIDCKDVCCSFTGVYIDIENIKRIGEYTDALESYCGVPRTKWFEDEYLNDGHYFIDREYTSTQSSDGICVFRSNLSRGCSIHRFCLEEGLDFHDIKPFYCVTFPITFANGIILPQDEIAGRKLPCFGSGKTIYRASQRDLEYYFGEGLVLELDEVEKQLK